MWRGGELILNYERVVVKPSVSRMRRPCAPQSGNSGDQFNRRSNFPNRSTKSLERNRVKPAGGDRRALESW
jgi:hypothetical protein